METEMNVFVKNMRHELGQGKMLLKDIRVLDMGTVVAAPFAGTFMADFGAEVIKIENPGLPDGLRAWGVNGGVQPWFAVVNRNKFPVTLNIRTPEGAEIFRKLARESDVLLENFRGGVLDRLGFSAKNLFEINKGLIIGRISGYGQNGPYSSRPGFGTLAEGFSGFSFLNREAGKPPLSPPMALADMIAGSHLAFAVMAALREAKRGQYGGQEIDISLYEPLLGMLGGIFLGYWLSGEVPQPMGNEMAYTAPRNNYQTKDGEWLAMSCSAQVPFERLMDAIGKPEYKTDPRFRTNEVRIIPKNRKELNRAISEWFSKMTMKEALAACEEKEVTAGPIMSMGDIGSDPHVLERQTMVNLPDPLTGRKLRFPDIAMRLSSTPGKIRFPGLPAGAANEAIFGDMLGYTNQQLADYKQKKII